MNRALFMKELEFLLRDLSDAEREEALQYYNDYFDDAGEENEDKVIADLGNPRLVAKSIKKDAGLPVEEEAEPEKDTALAEYSGEKPKQEESEEQETQEERENPFEKLLPAKARGKEDDENSPLLRIILIVVGIVFALAIWKIVIRFIAAVVGLFFGWFGLIMATGVVAIAMVIGAVALLLATFALLAFSPWLSLICLGLTLLCGAIGLLSLMACVAMSVLATPAAWRGIKRLFGWLESKKNHKSGKEAA